MKVFITFYSSYGLSHGNAYTSPLPRPSPMPQTAQSSGNSPLCSSRSELVPSGVELDIYIQSAKDQGSHGKDWVEVTTK